MKSRQRRSVLLALLLLAPAARAAEPASPPLDRPLDALFESDGLWESGPAQFTPPNANFSFHWTSAAADTLQTTLPGLSLFEIPVTTAVVRFHEKKPREVDILFYSRGDNGELSKDGFEALCQRCEEILSALTKTSAPPPAKDAASAVKAETEEWHTPKTRFVLGYSSVREVKTRGIPFRAEFVRLVITPMDKPRTLLEEALAPRSQGPFSGPSHVKKEASGDVLITGIPMVDQGQKGYCVDASVERVLRYYGQKVDQNELAEIANSSAEQGTSVTEMVDALKKLTGRLRIKTKVESPFDERTLQSIITEYNRTAKKGKRADQLDLYEQGGDMASLYHQMNFDILREARTKNPSEMERFEKLVETHVDQGIPLLWSVMVGLAPEHPAIHGFGGHMRLLIGYNTKTGEVLYSDTWGPGHELKRMPLADAWAITTGLNSIEPL